MCSWKNPDLLKVCINSLIESKKEIGYDIGVVLNEGDKESAEFLMDRGIHFVFCPENKGVLAIDYLNPLISQYEYVVNTNDDMIFHKGFAEDLVEKMDSDNFSSVSCSLVENFNSNNPCVFPDSSLGNILDPDTTEMFQKKCADNVYKFDRPRISYCHPICVRVEDWISVGGYSDNWNDNFSSGYSMDDYFAYKLIKIRNKYPICSEKSFVFHGSGTTMKRLPQETRDRSNSGEFERLTGMTIHQFRGEIGIGREAL